MKRIFLTAAALVLSTALAATAGPTLKPANPQPSGLKKGLKVSYSMGGRPRSIGQAKSMFSGKAGAPLRGLNWPDKGRGAKVMTSGTDQRVSARISGYMKFDAPGEYTLEFWANDGLEINVGGARVGKLDGINPCSSAGATTVTVPQAGWYPLDAFYYQKEGTACLEAEWKKGGGGVSLIPDKQFGH